MRLRVITLNVWQGAQLERLVEFVEHENPDVLMLQEVTSGVRTKMEVGVSDVYEQLVEKLPLNGVFSPVWKYRTDPSVYLGTAIFSKLSIVGEGASFYYRELVEVEKPTFGEFPGKVQWIDVKTHIGNLRFATTHFVWSMHPEITDEQRVAIEGLIGWLGEEKRLVLAGDFNVTDDSEIYSRLKTVLEDDRPRGVENTLDLEIHKLRGSKRLAVDYVFHKGDGYELLESRVPQASVSDHLPVIVDYEIF